MAIEYDSDDIGELDDDADHANQGPATVEQFDNLLNEFLDDHSTQDHTHEAGFAYDSAAGSRTGAPADEAAIAKVCKPNDTRKYTIKADLRILEKLL